MGRREYFRDQRGGLVGWVDDDTNEERAYDSRGRFVGRHRKATDQTLDDRGRMVTTHGNALSSLIFGRKK